jgi:hypothetical protein
LVIALWLDFLYSVVPRVNEGEIQKTEADKGSGFDKVLKVYGFRGKGVIIMTILSFVVLGISAAIAYVVGIERVGREYDTGSKKLHSKAAKAKANSHAA